MEKRRRPERKVTCPRCQAVIAEPRAKRCPCCIMTLGVSFDPTAGLKGGERYLGRVIGGHFKVLCILAYGGHGVVLLVRHTKLENRNIFALKLLRPELSQNADFRRRFLREAEIVYTFSHPNIVPIREFAETDEGELFFTMDFCRGVTLDGAMRAGPPLSLERIIRISDGILQGLHFAHRHGVVHRDMKPANVFLEEGRDGELARILDFGIAKPNDGGNLELTTGQKIIGTPTYMAPEQILGKQLDCRTDLYSFGVLLYRMVAGKPPFGGRTGHEILARHLRDEAMPLRKLKPGIPKEFDDLVASLLAKPREARPASAAAVRETLLALTEKVSGNEGARQEMARRRPRSRVALLAIVGVVLAGAAWLGGSTRGRSLLNGLTTSGEAQAQERDEDRGPSDENAEGMTSTVTPPPSPEAPSDTENVAPGQERRWKWCRFCRQRHPVRSVTCPDCGQMLTRFPARAVNRLLNKRR